MTTVIDLGPTRAVIQLHRGPDGGVIGVGRSLTSLVRVGSQTIESDPGSITDETDPAWADFIGDFNVAAAQQVATLEQQLASAIEARNTAETLHSNVVRDLETAEAEIERLNALLNPTRTSRQLAPFDFRRLFTAAEFLAAARSTNNDLADGVFAAMSIQTFIDLDAQQTVGLMYLALQDGVLTQERFGQAMGGQFVR